MPALGPAGLCGPPPGVCTERHTPFFFHLPPLIHAPVRFDGGYTPDQAPGLAALFSSLQPGVVAFGAAGLCASPARWIGTESGYAPYPTWSTVRSVSENDAGDPTGGLWIPAETDFTL